MREKSCQIIMEMFLSIKADQCSLCKKEMRMSVDSASDPVLTAGSRVVIYRDSGMLQVNGIHCSANKQWQPFLKICIWLQFLSAH